MHHAPVKKLMFNPQSTVEWWSNPEVPLFLVEQSGSPAFFEIRCAVKVNHSTVQYGTKKFRDRRILDIFRRWYYRHFFIAESILTFLVAQET